MPESPPSTTEEPRAGGDLARVRDASGAERAERAGRRLPVASPEHEGLDARAGEEEPR